MRRQFEEEKLNREKFFEVKMKNEVEKAIAETKKEEQELARKWLKDRDVEWTLKYSKEMSETADRIKVLYSKQVGEMLDGLQKQNEERLDSQVRAINDQWTEAVENRNKEIVVAHHVIASQMSSGINRSIGALQQERQLIIS